MVIFKKGDKSKKRIDNQTKSEEKTSFDFKEMINRVFISKKSTQKEHIPTESICTQHNNNKVTTYESQEEPVKQSTDVNCSTARFLIPGITKQDDYDDRVEPYFIIED